MSMSYEEYRLEARRGGLGVVGAANQAELAQVFSNLLRSDLSILEMLNLNIFMYRRVVPAGTFCHMIDGHTRTSVRIVEQDGEFTWLDRTPVPDLIRDLCLVLPGLPEGEYIVEWPVYAVHLFSFNQV